MTKLIAALAMAAALAGPKDVTGTWNMGLQGDHVIPVGMELKQDGKIVTGTILLPTQNFKDKTEVALSGDFVDGALKLSGGANSKDHTGDLVIEAILDEDGVLTGTIELGGHGRLKWTAERLKVKK